MERFTIHIGFSLIGGIVFMLLWHVLYMNYWNLKKATGTSLWMWGDSQLYQAIQKHHWQREADIWFDSEHGYGYQDLISFSQRVPNEVKVLVSFGPMFYRVSSDRNLGGLCFECSKSLFDFHDRVDDGKSVRESLLKNMRQEYSLDIFQDVVNYPYPDSVNWDKRKAYVANIQSVIDNNDLEPIYQFKDSILDHTIRLINQRASRLLLLSLPVVDTLYQTNFSQVSEHYEMKLLSIQENLGFKLDTLTVTYEQDPFYDATHFNKTILLKFNKTLIRYWNNLEENTLLIVELEPSNLAGS